MSYFGKKNPSVNGESTFVIEKCRICVRIHTGLNNDLTLVNFLSYFVGNKIPWGIEVKVRLRPLSHSRLMRVCGCSLLRLAVCVKWGVKIDSPL